jgi:hypothetical protein
MLTHNSMPEYSSFGVDHNAIAATFAYCLESGYGPGLLGPVRLKPGKMSLGRS